MTKNTNEYTLKLPSKFRLFFLLAFIGSPLLYAAYLNFEIQELMLGTLLVILFIAWSLVILLVTGFKIRVTETAVQKEGLLEPTTINYKDVETIHFGSTWSDFHLQSNGTKVFISKDFEGYEDIIASVIDRIKSYKQLQQLEITGESDNIDKFGGQEIT